MRRNLYCIKDVKVAAFTSPFTMPGDVQAMRYFHEIAVDEKTTIFKYPSDFELHRLGSFDDSTGELHSGLKFLSSAVTIVSSVFPDGG